MTKAKVTVKPPIFGQYFEPGTWEWKVSYLSGMFPFGSYYIELVHPKGITVMRNDMWTAYTERGAYAKAERIAKRYNKQEIKAADINERLRKLNGTDSLDRI